MLRAAVEGCAQLSEWASLYERTSNQPGSTRQANLDPGLRRPRRPRSLPSPPANPSYAQALAHTPPLLVGEQMARAREAGSVRGRSPTAGGEGSGSRCTQPSFAWCECHACSPGDCESIVARRSRLSQRIWRRGHTDCGTDGSGGARTRVENGAHEQYE